MISRLQRGEYLLLSTAEDMAAFVKELQRESDRGLPLVATSLLDELLRETLRALFCDNPSATKALDGFNAPIGTFSSRVETCHALGLIDQFEYAEVNLLRKVRNEFAHSRHGKSFGDEKIISICASLKSDLPGGSGYQTEDAKFRFINSTVVLVLRLYHRPDWVKLERREPREWVSNDQTTWRSIEDDPPPPGVSPIMVIGRSEMKSNKERD